MYLPLKFIIEMQKLNKNFYEIIIPYAFLELNKTFKNHYLDSKIISDYRIILKIHK